MPGEGGFWRWRETSHPSHFDLVCTQSGQNPIMDRPETALAPAHAAILDKLMDIVRAAGPLDAQTDKYFTNTSRIAAHGDGGDLCRSCAAAWLLPFEPAIRIARALVPDVKIRCPRGGRRGRHPNASPRKSPVP